MRTIVNISLPRELGESLEHLMEKGNYATKSEFLRELIRDRVEEEDIVKQIKKSEAEFRAGKGKVLHSLKDLR
ncbi:MAG: ribbon-helix-helix domain-containing protein [bacterium]|nr:ribbon-helix-helix domain-containing protein [bacterium]